MLPYSNVSFQVLVDLNRQNIEDASSNSTILQNIRSPDIRALNNLDEDDGYLIPKNEGEQENSSQSVISRRNIHGLSLIPPAEEDLEKEYLAMRSPRHASNISPKSPFDYTHMSIHSDSSPRTPMSPTSLCPRNYYNTPTIHENEVFTFPTKNQYSNEVDNSENFQNKQHSTITRFASVDNPHYYQMGSNEKFDIKDESILINETKNQFKNKRSVSNNKDKEYPQSSEQSRTSSGYLSSESIMKTDTFSKAETEPMLAFTA